MSRPCSHRQRSTSGALVGALVLTMMALSAAAQPNRTAAEEPRPTAGKVRIFIDNVAGDLGPAWPMYCGVPFPKGSLKDLRHVRVVDADGKAVPAQMRRLSNWPGTEEVRWLGVDFAGDPAKQYFVEFGPDVMRPGTPAERPAALFKREGDRFVISTGPARFIVPTSGPLISRGYLDLNGDGQFTDDELMIENTAGDDLYLVDNQGREATIGRDAEAGQARAEPDEAGFLEQGDALHACVRREGWYVAANGDKVARHITRLHFYAGKPFVRVEHTLVLTKDTNKLWFRDIGIRFRQRVADARAVTFDASHQFDENTVATQLGPEDRSIYMFQEKYFNFGRTDPEKDARFVVARVSASGKEDVLKSGERCGEWVDVSGGKAGTAVVLRHLWQQFPKELEVAPGVITAHLWSSRGGREFDIRADTLRKYWPEEWLNTTYHKQANLDTLKRAVSDGLGMAKTHQLLLYLHTGNPASGRVSQVAHALEKPVLCLADPQWLYRSQAMGPIYPYDPQGFPKAEEWLEKCFDLATEKGLRAWGDYGFLEFGSGPHIWYRMVNEGPMKGRIIAELWHGYSHVDYGFCAQLWVLYVRSGMRKYFEMAEELNQERMDIEMVHWDDPKATLQRYTNTISGKFRGGFAIGNVGTPMPWGINTYLHRNSGTDLRMVVYPYYLSDNRWAWEVFQDYRSLVKKVWKRDPGDTADHAPYAYQHRVGATLRCLATVYQETGDEEIRALGQDWVNKLVDLKQPGAVDLEKFEQVGTSKYEVKAHALARWYEATGDDLARQAVLRFSRSHADLSMGDFPNTYYCSNGYYLGMAYRLSDDPAYARVLQRNLDLAVADYEEVLNRAKQTPGGVEALSLAMTGCGVYKGSEAIRSSILQDPPFAFDAISRYRSRVGAPVPATPMLQQARQGEPTLALFEKEVNAKVVLDVRSWYPFIPQVRSLSGQATEGVGYEGFSTAEFSYVSESKYTGAPHSYRITVPAGAPAGAYILDPNLAGAPWEVTWTNAAKIVLYAPQGLTLGGGKSWPPRTFVPGGAFPARAAGWYFLVPEGLKEIQLYLATPCELFKPDDQPESAVQGKTGWLNVPVAERDRGKLWKIFAANATFVQLRGVTPLFAYEEKSRHFLPDLSKMPAGEQAPVLADTNAPVEKGLYSKGAFQGSKSDLGLLLGGRRSLRLERGKPLADHRFEHFDCREGTLEFWLKPSLSSGYFKDSLKLLDAGPWRITVLPFSMHFQVESASWKPRNWSGAQRVLTGLGVGFEAGRWTHLAYQWYWKGDSFFIDAYVDGRLQNVGAALIPENERDHIDNKLIRKQHPNMAAFLPKDILERFTLGGGIEGVVDELRISDVRRYDRDFAPGRTSPFDPDARTLALFHFDGKLDGISGEGKIVTASVAGHMGNPELNEGRNE